MADNDPAPTAERQGPCRMTTQFAIQKRPVRKSQAGWTPIDEYEDPWETISLEQALAALDCHRGNTTGYVFQLLSREVSDPVVVAGP